MQPLRSAVLGVLTVCLFGAPILAQGGQEFAVPPKSWIVGSRSAPTDGAVFLGLLARSGAPRRLAQLVEKAKLDAFLRRLEAGQVKEEEIEEEIVEEVESPTRSVAPVRLGQVQGEVREVLADSCGDTPLVICPPRKLNAHELKHLQAYIRRGGVVVIEGVKEVWQRDLFGDLESVVSPDGLEGFDVIRSDGRIVGILTPRRPVITTWAKAKVREKVLRQLFRFALQKSAKVACLAGKPFAVRGAARKSGGGLSVDLELPRYPRARVASVRAALVAVDGKVLWKDVVRTGTNEVTLAVPWRDKDWDPVGTRLQLLWRSRGVVVRRAPTVERLVGVTNVQLLGSNLAEAGGAYGVRALLTESRSGEPVVGRALDVAIVRRGKSLAAMTARTDAHGTVDVSLNLPEETPPGRATLRVGRAEVGIEIIHAYRVHVVSDRTLYRPTDQVHARVMLRRFPSGRPAANAKVSIELRSDVGRGRSRKIVTTSEHGIASTTFLLVDQAAGGCTLTAQLGDPKLGARARIHSVAKFRVEAFELPRFELTCAPAAVVCRLGERVPIAVQARYMDGKPVALAKVKVRSLSAGVSVRSGKTDASGNFQVICRANAAEQIGSVTFVVTDQDGREEGIRVGVRCVSTDVALHVEPKGLSIVGRPLPVRVVARTVHGDRPVRGRLRWSGTGLVDRAKRAAEGSGIDLDADGAAELVLEPTKWQSSFFARLDREGAESVSTSWRFTSGDPQGVVLVVAPERLVAKVGETLAVDVRGDGAAGRGIFLDVVRDRLTLSTLSGELRDGVVRFRLPLTDRVAGLLTLRAYRWDGRQLRGASQRVLVKRSRRLAVTAVPDRPSYRPGDVAKVAVAITADGKPTSGVLGYWAVDGAVLARSPWAKSTAGVFDALPRSGGAQLHELLRPGSSSFEAARTQLGVGGTRFTEKSYQLRYDWLASRRVWAADLAARAGARKFADIKRAIIAAVGAIPLREFPRTHSLRQTIGWLLRHGRFDAETLRDPWGQPFDLCSSWQTWRSAGPDGVAGTKDDIHRNWEGWQLFEALPEKTRLFLRFVKQELRGEEVLVEEELEESAFDSNQWNTTVGLGGGTGGRYSGRRGGRYNGAAAPPRVRKDFPPTLTFVPQHIIGPSGRTTLDIKIADSLTTWRMRMVGSTMAGHVGVGETALVVTQPFQVEPWVTPHLTVGDFVEVPALVRNDAKRGVRAGLKLGLSGGLASVGADTFALDVGAQRAAAHRFGVRATKSGAFTLRVDAAAGAATDAVSRVVSVRPFGQPMRETQQSVVTKEAPWRTKWRSLGGGVAPSQLRMTILPDALATTLSGFEGLVREPHGCFEQTSSTLYPMVLALQILAGRKGADGEEVAAIRARARQHVAKGYRRLLSFEVGNRTGAFELYGRKPGNVMLTAYGLLEFSDIAKVQSIESDLIPRIRRFLKRRQNKDGSFEASHFGTVGKVLESKFRTTAYVAWAFAATGKPLQKSAAWLAAQCADVEDCYGLALAALALQKTDTTLARKLAARVLAKGEKGKDGRVFAPSGSTPIGARGRTGRLEATALAANALDANGLPFADALEWLAAHRSHGGQFGTTFATVLALKAFVAAERGVRMDRTATVRVMVDGKEVARRGLRAGVSAPIHAVLAPDLPAGSHDVQVQVDGDRTARVALTMTNWRAWPARLGAAKGRVAMQCKWPTGALPVGKVARCSIVIRNPSNATARNIVAEIGLPPGCTVDKRDFAGPRPARLERGDEHLVVYVDALAPGRSMRYQLAFTPRFRLKVRTAPSRVYEYYTPEEAFTVPPSRVSTW